MKALVLCLFVFSGVCTGVATEQQIGQPRPLQEMDATIEPAVKVSWPSQVGEMYSIEASFDLHQWEEQAVVQAQGLTTSWYEAITQYPKRFYRIREKESLGKLLGVLPSFTGAVSDLYIVYSDGTGGRQIKYTLGAVRPGGGTAAEDKVLYTEETIPGSEVCDLKLYDVASDSTTTLTTGVGRGAFFDAKDPMFCLYCDSEANLRRARIDNFPGQTLVDSSYDIRSFWPSLDGSVIVTMEIEGKINRLAAYDASGALIRVLGQGEWDWWNFSIDRTGQWVFFSYIDEQQGQKKVKIIHVRAPVSYDLAALLPLWTRDALFMFWAPYNNLLDPATGDFYSSIDGSMTTDNTLQPGLNWIGWDNEGYLYRVSPDLTRVQKIEE